jgi:hypothetical protein
MAEAVRHLGRTGARLTWSVPSFEPALSAPWDDPQQEPLDEDDAAPVEEGGKLDLALPGAPGKPSVWDEMAPIAAEAVLLRARAAQSRREAALRRMGVRVVRLRHASVHRNLEAPEPGTPAAGR